MVSCMDQARRAQCPDHQVPGHALCVFTAQCRFTARAFKVNCMCRKERKTTVLTQLNCAVDCTPCKPCFKPCHRTSCSAAHLGCEGLHTAIDPLPGIVLGLLLRVSRFGHPSPACHLHLPLADLEPLHVFLDALSRIHEWLLVLDVCPSDPETRRGRRGRHVWNVRVVFNTPRGSSLGFAFSTSHKILQHYHAFICSRKRCNFLISFLSSPSSFSR